MELSPQPLIVFHKLASILTSPHASVAVASANHSSTVLLIAPHSTTSSLGTFNVGGVVSSIRTLADVVFVLPQSSSIVNVYNVVVVLPQTTTLSISSYVQVSSIFIVPEHGSLAKAPPWLPNQNAIDIVLFGSLHSKTKSSASSTIVGEVVSSMVINASQLVPFEQSSVTLNVTL